MEIKSMKIFDKINKLPVSGKAVAVIKAVLFIDAAVIMGLWLGIKLFFPDDYILSKINEQLFVRDMALLADDIEVSLLGNISFDDGTLMQKGNKVLTFSELSFSPAIFATLGGHPAGKVYVSDMNAQGGELEATFETGENPCYTFDSQELPLSVTKPFLGEVVLTGGLNGTGEICLKENKYSGKIDLKGSDVVLRGKVPTPMGDFDVGKIILGEIELLAEIAENKAEIKRLSVKGIFELTALGKVTLNVRNPVSSRLDLEIRARIPDMTKISENVALNLLVSQLSQYKDDEENSFALTLKGFLNKPQMGKAAKERRDQKNEIRQKKTERPVKNPRQTPTERLPQRIRPNEMQPERENQESVKADLQNDELKKKEDELKRKEDELKRKEEAAKEREERMREEREQREKEERERKEQEERNRIEEEARIHAAQEAAMDEIRRAREEIEASRRNNPPEDESEEIRRKSKGDEKIEGDEE